MDNTAKVWSKELESEPTSSDGVSKTLTVSVTVIFLWTPPPPYLLLSQWINIIFHILYYMYCIKWNKLEFVDLSTSIYIIQFPLKIGENGVFFTREWIKI